MTTPLRGTAAKVGAVQRQNAEKTEASDQASLLERAKELGANGLAMVDSAADRYELFQGAVDKTQKVAARLAKGRLGPAVLGGAASGLIEKIAPRPIEALAGRVSENMASLGGKMEAFANSSTGVKVTKGLAVAGAAAIAYDTVTTFRDTEGGVGTKATMAGAAIAGNALFFASAPAGTVLLAAEVLTGGGVTGGVKGLAAGANALVTGDRTALNQWKEQAKSGDHGWAMKWAMGGGEPAAVTKAKEVAGNVTGAVSGAMSSAWNRLAAAF